MIHCLIHLLDAPSIHDLFLLSWWKPTPNVVYCQSIDQTKFYIKWAHCQFMDMYIEWWTWCNYWQRIRIKHAAHDRVFCEGILCPVATESAHASREHFMRYFHSRYPLWSLLSICCDQLCYWRACRTYIYIYIYRYIKLAFICFLHVLAN